MSNAAIPPLIQSDAFFSNILLSGRSEFKETVLVPEPTLPNSATNKEYVDNHSGGDPGLPFGSVQFNNNGVLGGSSDFIWDNDEKILTVNGNVVAQNNLSISDATLKSNIYPLNSDQCLETLAKIECFKYKLLDSEKESYGVMAQQLEEIGLENIVHDGPTNKSVAYAQLLPLVIASMKKLDEKINSMNFIMNQISTFNPDEEEFVIKTHEPIIKKKRGRSPRRKY
jgi:hypothetical protein